MARSTFRTSERVVLTWPSVRALTATWRGCAVLVGAGLVGRFDLRLGLHSGFETALQPGARVAVPLEPGLAECLRRARVEPGRRVQLRHDAGSFVVTVGWRRVRVAASAPSSPPRRRCLACVNEPPPGALYCSVACAAQGAQRGLRARAGTHRRLAVFAGEATP